MNYWSKSMSAGQWIYPENRKGPLLFPRSVGERIEPDDIVLVHHRDEHSWVAAFRVRSKHLPRPTDEEDDIPDEAWAQLALELEPIVVFDEASSGLSDSDTVRPGRRRSVPLPKEEAESIVAALQRKVGASGPVLRRVGTGGKSSAGHDRVDERPATEEHAAKDEDTASEHTAIQYQLLRLGASIGFDVWVARNDRSKIYRGETLGGIARMLSELPAQFDRQTTKLVELIDVLWLNENTIEAAFEVECTTSVYSGLLRMSDLLALQPNLNIRLFLVAPDEREEKVRREILRPTFTRRTRPLAKLCGFIPTSRLMAKVGAVIEHGLESSLTSKFLDQIATYFSPDGAA